MTHTVCWWRPAFQEPKHGHETVVVPDYTHIVYGTHTHTHTAVHTQTNTHKLSIHTYTHTVVPAL